VRIVDVGQEAHGIFAFGQMATGFVAVGQVATGVIAIGQVARGGVAIGQVSFGLWSVGMGSAGVFWCAAMLGVGARGRGGVIPVVPSYGPVPKLPDVVPLDQVERSGWVRARVSADDQGPRVEADGRILRVDASLRGPIERRARDGAVEMVARVTRRGDLVVDRLMEIPTPAWKEPTNWAWWASQVAALAILSMLYAALVAAPVIEGVIGAIRTGG
jgi:hypothetical protein